MITLLQRPSLLVLIRNDIFTYPSQVTQLNCSLYVDSSSAGLLSINYEKIQYCSKYLPRKVGKLKDVLINTKLNATSDKMDKVLLCFQHFSAH